MTQSNSQFIWWIACLFLIVAVLLSFNFWGRVNPIVKNELVDPVYFSTQPVRAARLAPVTEKDGLKLRCNDCHQNIQPSIVRKSHISSHDEIKLQHGINNYCTTCHSLNKREFLIDMQGEEIPFSKSEFLCQKCHGTIFNDWEKGAHGRINGYWDRSKGEVKKLTCVSCHDPHQPKFQDMKPAPAPMRKGFTGFLEKYIEQKEDAHE